MTGLHASPLAGQLLDTDSPEWAHVLRETPHDFYHLPAYAELTAAQAGARPSALHVTDGTRKMLLPLLIRPIPGGGVDAASPYGYPGPVGFGTTDASFLRLALAAGLDTLREAGLVSVFIRLHPLLNPALPDGIGDLVHHGDTVSVDLTRTEAELWAGTRLNHRRDIMRASRLGYVARMDERWACLDAFKRMYRETMERRSASSSYYFNDAYFDGLRTALGASIHLCVVETAGAIAAAGLFAETGGIVQYHLSGTRDMFRDVQPLKLMLHYVRTWAKQRGNSVFHLGGGVGGVADSLLHFKLGFSPRRHSFATLRLVIDEREYERLAAIRNPGMDPRIRSGFFPVYRER